MRVIDEDDRIATKDAMSSKELVALFLEKLNVNHIEDCSITLNWAKIVQGEYYKHLKVKEIKYNNVIVVADHPAWAQKATMRKKELLRKIQKEFPSLGVQSIKIICK
ncbi:MAG: DUF721 domain-containing protein [Sphaerochaetaceae bacterium]|nr:DUF721 domain-containing protein [Sphaerochaetaceae bacterium]